ncbi:MAG TPA: hypothetical protein PK613_22450 [Anaerolineaceae bacterium]|nr:hypothetical protein [Anaerolineaceae bacterium]
MKRISLGKFFKLFAIGTGLFFFLVICYFTLFRAIDSCICIPRVAQKLGIPATESQIYQYVEQQLTPGIKKAEVMDRLSKIGEVKITGNNEIIDGAINEWIDLKICSHPLNNIVIFNSYSVDWTLIGTYIERDSP